MQAVGQALDWHGGLTLDYFHTEGEPQFIECNPRTVEPGNAAAAGVDLPALMIALSRGAALPDAPVVGRAGVRTHSCLALALGAASTGSRRRALAALIRDGGPCTSREVLTPIHQDPVSAVPLVVTVARAVLDPTGVDRLAAGAVDRYAVTPDVIGKLAR